MSLIIKISQNLFKNKSKRKRNFIIYHFLVESKPHEKIDLLITASVNIYQAKKEKRGILIVMKTWKPPVSKRTPLFLSNFF